MENIIYITNSEMIEKEGILDRIVNSKQIALDTETTGLDYHRCKICILQIGLDSGEIIIINVHAVGLDNLQLIGRALNNSGSLLILHNSKFDLKFLHKAGVILENQIYDTMLAEQVLAKGLRKSGFALADVVKTYADVELNKAEQTSCWSREELTESQINYAAADVRYLHMVCDKQLKQAEKESLIETILLECEAVKATYKMELAGILVDEGRIKQLQITLTEESKTLLKEIYSLLPQIKNPQSPRQVMKALQEEGIILESTDKDILVKHSGEHKAIPLILQYRKICKNIEVLNTLLKSIHLKTGRIHADFKQNSTVTGRYSCSNPNLQGIPHDLRFRACFRASQGKSFIICDYSQMELRIIASIAKEETMINIYNTGQDIHRLTASIINNCPYEEVTEDMRSNAKALNFGLIYGMQPKTFADYARTRYHVELSLGEAKYQVEQFFKQYKMIGRRINQLLDKPGNDEETLNGRKRAWHKKPPITERANFAVQGTGADILKVALAEVNRQLLIDSSISLVSTIHDEIILEVPNEKAIPVSNKLKAIMEEAGRKFIQDVPIIADVSVGKDWASK